MTDAEPPPRTPERIDQVLFGALAGLSAAFVLQMIDKQPTLDSFLSAALLCFCVALPLLVASFLLEVARPGEAKALLRMLFDLAGVSLAVAGFVLLVFHIQLLSGYVILVAVCLSFVVVVRSLR